VNAAFTEITGYTHEEVVGRNPRILRSGKNSPGFYAGMWDTLRKGMPWEGLFCNRRKDGQLYWEDQRITPIKDAAGNITHYLAIKADATGSQQLLQAQKMEAVGQLTGGLAHDFSNLIGIIAGSLDLLRQQLPAGFNMKYLDAAKTAAQRGTDITHALLAVARRRPLNPVDIDINVLLEELAPLIRQTVGPGTEVSISANADDALVHIDAGGFSNAILNLVINARDAMPEGGRLLVYSYSLWIEKELEMLQLDLVPGVYVVVGVDDSGSGMSREVVAKAFEPFFTTKGEGKGTGLGLAMVYGFCRQSGGITRIDSTPGRGSSIQLVLPWSGTVARSTAAPVEQAIVASQGVQRILIVDTEGPQLRSARDKLNSLGHEVGISSSPAKALSMLASQNYDLLITGSSLPDDDSSVSLAALAQAIAPRIRILKHSLEPAALAALIGAPHAAAINSR
jgi:two-component system NtrC family sensor kinase